MRTLIDRADTSKIKHLDRMIAELSKYMNEFEIDQSVELLSTLSTSKWDVNLSPTDAAVQLKMMLGSHRYEYIKAMWAKDNSHLINNGRTKYIHKETKVIYDGLDPEDNPLDYDKVTM